MLEGAYRLRRPDQQEADRRARSARHPAAGARQARRLPDPGVGNLRARHHRRAICARRRKRRSSDLRRGRRALAQAVRADAAAALHLRIHLFRAAGFDHRRPQRLRRAQGVRRRACPRGARHRRRGRSGARFRRARGDRLCAGIRHPLRARHHPQSLCRAHLHRADPAHPPARRAPQAQRQSRRGRRQAHRADRRLRSCAAPPR